MDWIIGIGMALVVLFWVAQQLWARRPRKPTLPVAPPETGPSGRWNAVVAYGDRWRHQGRGVLTLAHGRLGFAFEGMPQPAWVLPCGQLRAAERPWFGSLGRTDLELHGPFGEWHLIVSQDRISDGTPPGGPGYDQNDPRERRYAREFLSLFAAAGGVVGGR